MSAPRGELWEGVLPGVLRELYVGRRSGLLTFTAGGERRAVRLRHGHIVSANTNVREDRLGEVLRRHGLLSEGDLKRATGFVLRDGKRLGAVLVELDLMEASVLEDALALHVREVLGKIFSWSQGSYEFEDEPEDASLAGDVTLRLSTGELILQAARSVADPDVVRYNLGDLDRVLGLSADPLLRFQKIALTPVDGYVVSRVDGTLSAREVLELIPLPAEETQRSLYGLLSTGVVEFLPGPPKAQRSLPPPQLLGAKRPVPPAAPEPVAAVPAEPPAEPHLDAEPVPHDPRRLEILEAFEGLNTRTHFEVLHIARDATEAQVKEAYFRMAKRFHPDVHHDPALSDLRGKLEDVFIRLGEAYEVLRNPRMRASYERSLTAAPAPSAAAPPAADPELERRMAIESVRKAERSIHQEKYWEAIQLLESAIPRIDGKPKQTARVLLARAYSKNPNWVKQGEELLLTVVHEDPRNLEAHLALGTIYRMGALRARAITMFRKALELDPENAEALDELSALGPEAGPLPPESGGLLKKLLRKGRE